MALNIFKKENKSKNPLVGRSGADVTMVPAAPSLGIKNSGVAISALGKEVSGNKVTNLNPDIANQKLNQSWQSDYQKTVDGGTDFNKGAISAPGRWFAKVAKNKFPAVAEGEAGPRQTVGPYLTTEARGLHEP